MKSTYCEYILEKMLSTSEVGPILALIAPSPFRENVNVLKNSLLMKSTERHFQNTERTYHCIIMHIFKKQKQKEKQSIIKLNKQSINLT
jgi:hypothetical protein